MGTQVVGNQVVWFDLPCTNLDRAIAFYSAVLGCAVSKEEVPGFTFAVLPHSDNTVGGCLGVTPDNPPADHGILIYLNCDGRLDAAIDAVGKNGGSVLKPKESIGPHGFRAIVKDSEGNRVALHST